MRGRDERKDMNRHAELGLPRAPRASISEGESLEERPRLESAWAGASSLRGGTAAFLWMTPTMVVSRP